MNDAVETIRVNIVDVENRLIFPAEIGIQGGRIARITTLTDREAGSLPYAIPGFVDAHVHIESSMLVPTEFARLATCHGTVATVSDPHEIANVLGVAGVEFMIENAKLTPLKICFGAPSCVPATAFETAGATIDAEATAQLLMRPEIGYLAEMMNYPGVLFGDAEVQAKLAAAKRLGKPVDGHAPGLTGDQAIRYIEAGISTDHECTTLAEAQHKLRHGMKILIREGSAAKNFEALHALIDEAPDMVMLCSDDKHPDELVVGHINLLVKRAVAAGHDVFNVLKAACLNPVLHYGLDVGRLRIADPADFAIVKDLVTFQVQKTYINGRCVAEEGKTRLQPIATPRPNQFNCSLKSPADFIVATAAASSTVRVNMITAIDGKLVTEKRTADVSVQAGQLQADATHDRCKLAVINRYQNAPVAKTFVHGFGLQRGAIASSVSHDSHNLIAVGVTDQDICRAVNALIEVGGGIAAVDGDDVHVLPLPIAGLMTSQSGEQVASLYAAIDRFTKTQLGSTLSAPFMTLSFMALLVIPAVKLSDLGLFDGERFEFIETIVGD